MSALTDGRLPIADRRAVRRTAWRLILGDRPALIAVLAFTCLAALAAVAGPWLLGRIINDIESGQATRIDPLAVAVLGCALAQLVLTRFARRGAFRFGERALARLREEFVDRTLALPPRVVERAGTGDLMTRASADVATVGTTLRDAVPDMVVSVVHVVFLLGAIALMNPLLGLCALLGTPVLVLATRWYLARARDAYLAEGAATSEVAESMAATAEGARTVEALELTARRLSDVDSAIDRAYGARMRTLFLRSILFPAADFSYALPVGAVLLAGGFAYLNGLLSLGTVIAGALYAVQLTEPMDRILMRIEQLQSGGASFARIIGVRAAAEPGPITDREPADDRIEVRGVRYAYVEGRDVLRDIDLTVRPGERLALVGPSGAGKSTLGRLLSGTDFPRTGSVRVGGVAVAELPSAERARRIVLVTQDHHVFIGTVRENLTIAAPDASDADTYRALAAVTGGDGDWIADLPDGLDTVLGPGGLTLDATKAQQLALARVIMADPHTVILDEATSLLDPTTARRTERSLGAVLAGRTVIAIAHRLHTAHDADRVAVIDGGRLTELGSHDTLVAADGAYAALWRSWHGLD